MSTPAEHASLIYNQVMQQHQIALRSAPADFTIGEKCVFPALNQRGESLSNQLFDLLFPHLDSGIYYHYLALAAFEKVVEHGSLRFFSTKKLNSIGEFVPLCRDLELDGYWRADANGNPEGEHAVLMDDLFYKSFVSCPETNADQLWDTFAEHGTGVRIAVHINANPNYPDFRRVSYQESKSVEVLKELLKAFRDIGRHFIPFGISRMPAYHQLREYAYQNECRLIAKRHPGAHDCFPFQVGRDDDQQCNYIDCSLKEPTCTAFQLQLVDVEAGPSCDMNRFKSLKSQISGVRAPTPAQTNSFQ